MPSVLADFVGELSVETSRFDESTTGRVLLSKTQLVLAISEDEKEQIQLDSIFDIRAGTTPQFVDGITGRPVTIAYHDGTDRVTAVVAGDDQTSAKFETVLFKAILNGTFVTLKHPSKVGGRVMDTDFQGSIMSLGANEVRFDVEEGPLVIALDSIVDFSREPRTVDDGERPVLVVTHAADGDVLETIAATDSQRKLSILGRFLRGPYEQLRRSLRKLTLSEAETEALTTIYSTGGMDVSLPSVLGMEPERVRKLLHSLHEKSLVESNDGGPVLTAKGQIVVNEYLERINT